MCKKILVVVDDNAPSQSAVRLGIEMAQAHRAALLLFHVLPKFEVMGLDVLDSFGASSQEFESKAREKGAFLLASACALAESEGVQSFRAMGCAEDDAKCVADAAASHHCDLIVVGTEGRNALVRLLTGSIVPGLITAASVPVIVCKDVESTSKRGRRAKSFLRARSKSSLIKETSPDPIS